MDSSGLANHVVALVKGVTTSQTIDMAIVLQVSLPVLVAVPTHDAHIQSQHAVLARAITPHAAK